MGEERPFSVGVILLRILWEGPYVLLWALFILTANEMGGEYEMNPYVVLFTSILVLGSLLRLLRPQRQRFCLAAYEGMARSGFRPLMELAVWKLLLVAYRYWPDRPITDHIGIATLHRIYDCLDDNQRKSLLEIVQRLEQLSHCNLVPAARDFLREIEVSPAA